MEFGKIVLLDQTGIKGLTHEHLASDPSGADLWDGRSWFNTTEKQVKKVENGVIVVTANKAILDAALTAAGLEANGTLAALTGTNYLTGAATLKAALTTLDTQVKSARDVADAAVTSGQLDTAVSTAKSEAIADAATAAASAIATQSTADRGYTDSSVSTLDTSLRSYVDGKVNGLTWKAPVAGTFAGTDTVTFADFPGGASTGDRYINTEDAKVYTKTAGGWDSYIPSNGDTVINLAVDLAYSYDVTTTAWVQSSVSGTYSGSAAIDVTGTVISLKAASVAASHLGNDVAGNGLQGGNGSALALKVVSGSGLTVDGTGLGVDMSVFDAQFLKPSELTYGTFEYVGSSAVTTVDITHNLAVDYPAITCFDVDTGKVIIPSDVTRIDANTTRVEFSVARKVAARFVK